MHISFTGLFDAMTVPDILQKRGLLCKIPAVNGTQSRILSGGKPAVYSATGENDVNMVQ